MLGAIRRSTSGGFGRIVLIIAMSILIVSFAVWGIGDMVRGRVDTAVARVGDARIDADEFQRAFQRNVEQLRRRFGPEFDSTQARALGLDGRVLGELVRFAAFDQATAELGLHVSDTLLKEEIRTEPAFQGEAGTFDGNVFRARLREIGYTESGYLSEIRRETSRLALAGALEGGISMPGAIIQPLLSYFGERRIARYIVVPPDAEAPIPPSDADVKSFYDNNGALFMAPEYRRLVFVRIDPEAVAASLPIEEAAMQAHYDAHKDRYTVPEKRNVDQIVLPDESAAQEASAALLANRKTFEAIAAERGLAPADIALGAKLKSELAPAIAEAAFALPSGTVSAPVKTPFGFALLRASVVEAGRQKPFEDVRAEIRAELAAEAASAEVLKIADALENARGGGATLEEAAKSVDLEAVVIEATDAQGRDKSGAPIAALAKAAEVLDEAFKSETGQDADIVAEKDGAFHVVRVDAITPTARRPLDEVKADATARLIADRRRIALRKKVEALAEQGRNGASIDAIGKALGRVPLTSEPLTRDAETANFSREAVDRLFDVTPGAFAFGPVKEGESLVLMQLQGIEKPSADLIAAQSKEAGETLAQTYGREIVDIYGAAIEARYGVRINDAMLKSALGEP